MHLPHPSLAQVALVLPVFLHGCLLHQQELVDQSLAAVVVVLTKAQDRAEQHQAAAAQACQLQMLMVLLELLIQAAVVVVLVFHIQAATVDQESSS
jgi:hypothetical protein